MEEQNGYATSCFHCHHSPMCSAYRDMAEAFQVYNRIAATPGKVWASVVCLLAEDCQFYEQDDAV